MLAAMQMTADSEGGALYVDRYGVITWDNRYAVVTDARQKASGAPVFGGTGNAPIIVDGYEQDFMSTIYNRATVTPLNQPAEIYNDTASQTSFRISEITVADAFMDSSAWSRALNRKLVLYNKDAQFTTSQFGINLRHIDTLSFDKAVQRELQDFIQVKFTPPQQAERTYNCRVRKIEHHIDAQSMTWIATFGVSNGSRYTDVIQTGTVAVYDDGVTKYDGTKQYGY
jgi:hypothetical protein